MVFVRMTCGVHWLTDIIGGLIASAGFISSTEASAHLLISLREDTTDTADNMNDYYGHLRLI